MRIPNIFVKTPLQSHSLVELDDKAAQHIVKVLRMKKGFKLQLFDGSGTYYPAELVQADKKQVTAQTGEGFCPDTESPLYTSLGLVISRGDRMDYAVQKASELGLNHLTPLFSERCEVKLNDERQLKRQQHWQHVAISASEQCGRATVPDIAEPMALNDWLQVQTEDSLKLVLHHRDTQNLSDIAAPPKHVCLLIGPEGGLTEVEINMAKEASFLPCTLGPRVFRTETAPVAALSVIQWLWGDFSRGE